MEALQSDLLACTSMRNVAYVGCTTEDPRTQQEVTRLVVSHASNRAEAVRLSKHKSACGVRSKDAVLPLVFADAFRARFLIVDLCFVERKEMFQQLMG
jgi:hypothetical protein